VLQQDFNSIKDVYNYNGADVSKIVLKKFCDNLWYLSDEAIGFAFFHDNLSVDLKKKMIKALNLKHDSSDEIIKKLSIKRHEVS